MRRVTTIGPRTPGRRTPCTSPEETHRRDDHDRPHVHRSRWPASQRREDTPRRRQTRPGRAPAPRRERPGLRLHPDPDPRPDRRRPADLGLGTDLARRRSRRRLLLPVRPRGDRRVSPPFHPPRVQGEPRPAQRARDRRQPRRAGRRDHLGSRPPPPPRLRRQGRRPALPVAVRHHPGRAGPGLLPRPPGLVVRPRPHQRRPLHPGPARRPRHRRDQPAVPAVDRG